ncbi:MAG: hypothetical protein J0J00_01760, partial [Microbacterium sp.]|nr:hypothetical protein [Microbacterium sp.]
NVTLDGPQSLEALEFIKKMVPVSEEGPSAYEQNDMTTLFSDQKIEPSGPDSRSPKKSCSIAMAL